MRDYQAVIFDMDGVIVDSEPLHERAFLDLFAELGLGETHGIHFPDYYGRSDEALLREFVARHQPPLTFEELVHQKRGRFIKLLKRDQPIFTGLPELVEALAGHYPLAVASGSAHPIIDEVLAMHELHRFFPVTVSVYDVGHPKPAPDVFLRAAERLAVDPTKCCVIEDAAVGVQAAKAAGMNVIAITNSLTLDELRAADWTVETYAEIRDVLFESVT